jgi:DnaK suppressor protein
MAKSRRTPRDTRSATLRAMLEARQRELAGDMSSRMRDVRSRTTADRDGIHPEDDSGDIQDDLDLALIQMKAETLRRIENALQRLSDGRYGNCAECAKEIPSERLHALPFAIRCRPCEETRETRQRETRAATQSGYAQGRDMFE